MTVVRHWGAVMEWRAHAPLAEAEGLDPAAIEAIRTGEAPKFAEDAEAVVYGFCTEVLSTHRASAPTYAAALVLLGEEGLTDLLGVMGYYALVSYTLNVFEMEPPGSEDQWSGAIKSAPG